MKKVWSETKRCVLFVALGACFEGFPPKLVAQTVPATQERSVYRLIVRIHDYAQVKPGASSRAEDVAGQVFSAIGIELLWLDGPLTAAKLANSPGGLRDPGGAVVDVNILPSSMTALAKLPESKLGSTSLEYEGDCATVASVYYDRIERQARHTRASTAQLLGYAIAHELGHMLLRTSHHASTGIMIASWGPADLQHAAQGRLGFTPQQADYMRTEIQHSRPCQLSVPPNRP